MDHRESQALRIVRDALEVEPGARTAYVDLRCGADPALRARVDTLLDRAQTLDSQPDDAAPFEVDMPATDPLVGARLGPFRVAERIGRGGMGVVYRGEREDADFRQTVALKLIRRGYDFDDVHARFLRERRILSRLSHPHLARFIDGGVADDGRPWFALEYVEGEPITQWCDRRRLDVRARVQLLLDVCAAVQYAHTALVVHRDLKPGNILVDANGTARLLDFGIAGLLGGDEDGRAEATALGARPLTPAYAAPEQRAGEPGGVAADVYSLGVVAYELIAGVLPHPRDRTAERPAPDRPPPPLTRAITRDGAGRTPSTTGDNGGSDADTPAGHDAPARLAARNTTWRRYRATVRGDLTAIVHTALAVEPERRYPTVAAFAEDLQRWLDGVPVRVSGNGLAYRVGKFVRRNAVPVALAGVCLALLVAGVAGVMWQSRQTALAAERATTVKNFLADLLTSANPFIQPGATPTVRDLLDRAGERVEREFAHRPELAAELLGLIGTSYRGLGEMQLADRHLSHAIATADGTRVDPTVLGEIQAEHIFALIGRSEYAQAIATAEGALARLPDDADVTRSRLLIGAATAHLLAGDNQAALAHGSQAADLACADDAGDEQACVQALIELKYFRQFAGDQAGALTTAEEAWRRAERLHAGAENPQRVQAAGSYGDALAFSGRSEEAITLLATTVDLAREIYGERNFRYARALDLYAGALDEAERLPDALAATRQALEVAHAAMPRTPLSAGLVHRAARLELDLFRTDDAAATLDLSADQLPDPLPEYLAPHLQLDGLRLRSQRDGPTPDLVQEIAAFADARAAAAGTAFIPADQLAMRLAIEAGQLDLAERLLQRLRAAVEDAGAASVAQVDLLDAQLLASRGDIDVARTILADARSALEELDRPPGPLLFEAMRLEADLTCRRGDLTSGRRLHGSATAFWREHVDPPHLPAAVNALPASCDAG